MGWQVILGIALAIPAILIPVALLWYINVSGVYHVFRATRAREKKRAEARRKAIAAAAAAAGKKTLVGTGVKGG